MENPHEQLRVSQVDDSLWDVIHSADADSMQGMRTQAIHRQEVAEAVPVCAFV
jgi:hypothetical protein